MAYGIFNNRNPFIREYDEQYYLGSKFHNWTETRFFSPGQIQDVIASEYSDNIWSLSEAEKQVLNEDLKKALDPTREDFRFSFGIRASFMRKLPSTAKKAADV